MYVYADPLNKICKIIEVDCLFEAIAQVNKTKGALYLAEDNNHYNNINKNLNPMTTEDLLQCLVWKDGQLSFLGLEIVNFNTNKSNLD